MRYLFLIFLLFPALLFAGEETSSDVPGWAMVLTTGITALVAWAFSLWRDRMKADTEHHKLDSNLSLMQQKNYIIDRRLIPFLEGTTTHFLTLKLPVVLRDVSKDEFEWAPFFVDLRRYLRKRVLEKFAQENIDLIRLLGERELTDLIDRCFTRMITNLPGPIQALIPSGISANLARYASNFSVAQAENLLRKED